MPIYALLAVGGWLLVSPLVLSTTRVTAGMASAVTTGPALIVLAGLAEPARAMVARAEWNSILAGLAILLLAGSALWAARRRRGRPAPGASRGQRRQVATGARR